MDTTLLSADYQQLRGFVAVAQALSFSRAAGVMGVSPSALSQLVRGLEERLGTRLLNRTTRSVSLTEAGAALLARTEPALAELGEAMLQARAGREGIAGRVRVHASRFAGELHVLPILARFGRDYPDVVLDVSLDDTVIDIVAGGYDVAIRIGELVERDMVAVALGKEMRQLAVATPDYVAAHGVPEHPRDLLRHRCIRWRWPGNAAPYHWEFWEEGWFQVAVDGPLILDDKQACLEAALQGAGIAFAIEPKVREHIPRPLSLLSAAAPHGPGGAGVHRCGSAGRLGFHSAAIASGAASLRLAETTRFRPPSLAWYRAASAMVIRSASVLVVSGMEATPSDAEMFASWMADSASIRERSVSPLASASARSHSGRITTSSSPP